MFLTALAAVVGNVEYLSTKLLESHNLDDKGQFLARKPCSTPDQLNFYCKKLDACPMVTRWLTTGYEILFNLVPNKFLFAKNNKSCMSILSFAREEL